MDTLFFRRLAASAAVIGAATMSPQLAAEADPVRVILVGNSTVAANNGYGDALCRLFRPGVACINLAKNGRSSASYRAEGSWDAVTKLLRERAMTTYVLIQFGHNDQPGKPGRSTDLAGEFPANMACYAEEVKSAGAIPVLVTPLTRRSFHGKTLQNDLLPWAEATRRVAKEKQLPLLDLNADSAAAVAAMGPAEADTLAEVPPLPPGAPPPAKGEPAFDRTHLGTKGAALFARMVMQEIARALPALAAFAKPDLPDHGEIVRP